MIARGALFLAWTAVGAVGSYGAPYALTGYGLLILGAAWAIGLMLPAAGGRRWPEILGLPAGAGVFLLYAAAQSGATALGIAGALLAAASLVAYALAGRALCARA